MLTRIVSPSTTWVTWAQIQSALAPATVGVGLVVGVAEAVGVAVLVGVGDGGGVAVLLGLGVGEGVAVGGSDAGVKEVGEATAATAGSSVGVGVGVPSMAPKLMVQQKQRTQRNPPPSRRVNLRFLRAISDRTQVPHRDGSRREGRPRCAEGVAPGSVGEGPYVVAPGLVPATDCR